MVVDTEAALAMARDLLRRHGLEDWTVAFDRAVVRAGACHHRDRRITLSRRITAAVSQAEVRETVLHEIAHALVGERHGHDARWRETAVRIGASGRRCYEVGDTPPVPGRWQGRCAAGHVVHRHRRPAGVYLCRRCRGTRWSRVLHWEHDGRTVPHEELGPGVPGALRRLEAEARG